MPDGDAKASESEVHKVLDVKKYVCIRRNIPCKIGLIRTVRKPKNCPPKRQFVAFDVFTGKVFKATFSLSGTCVVPRVTYNDYELVAISEGDSYVTLIDGKGNIKDDLKLPTDEALLSQINVGFAEGKDTFVSVVSAMGKEQIISARVLDPE